MTRFKDYPKFQELEEAEEKRTPGKWKETKYEIVTTQPRNEEELFQANDYSFRIVADQDEGCIPNLDDKEFIVVAANTTKPILDALAEALEALEPFKDFAEALPEDIYEGRQITEFFTYPEPKREDGKRITDIALSVAAFKNVLTALTRIKELGGGR